MGGGGVRGPEEMAVKSENRRGRGFKDARAQELQDFWEIRKLRPAGNPIVVRTQKELHIGP